MLIYCGSGVRKTLNIVISQRSNCPAFFTKFASLLKTKYNVTDSVYQRKSGKSP